MKDDFDLLMFSGSDVEDLFEEEVIIV